ncbi:RNA-binding protein [Tepidibacillus fermentans]|uniref:RNA-binding protein YlmH n=1 Tax=Tepidibacillus fermentans TaxID=1281767 RepID=A0A4R3KLT1_9BACI|nr:YlmH/Sll1252 family protein [Tepidibacillus fermentans]TCS84396.1 RNA-binding protein YlmH [Tepidibacillus fermentans]
MGIEHILNHYRKEELPFVERMIDSCERVLRNHQPIRTDFVDPRQKVIIENIVNSYMDLTMFFDGGYEQAERGRVLIAPSYYIFDQEELGLHFFQILGENKFFELTHQNVLGALLNIGLKREKFGDILITDTTKQFIVASEVADYVRMELKQIGKTKIYLESIPRNQLNPPSIQYEIQQFSVSSLRIDAIVAQVFHQSRSKVVEWIKGKHVKVNWQIIDQVDYKLEVGDMVSLRKFGRFKLLEEEGITKKGRMLIKVGKII